MLLQLSLTALLALAAGNPQWNIPQIPGMPGIPQIPGIPKLPQIPGMPDFNFDFSTPVFPEDARTSESSRIVNGWPASVGQFPHQVRSITRISATQSSVCGGSILSETVVLTAAHCTLDHRTFELGFGSVDFNNPAVVVTTSQKIEHSGYNPGNLNNDLSLLILPTRLTFTRNIAPIALPRASQRGTTFANQKATVSGHGRTSDTSSVSSRLMYVNVRVINNNECARHYGTNIIRDFTLCTVGWDNNRQQTCQGDSGGPLITYDNGSGENILIGVVSFVSGRGCQARIPAGFVRVTSYLDWIQQNTGIRPNP
eukprot:GHVU01104780.1.p1 GENE.GHVU01104780.1~~GHVU01104780.1.p1  ORF type:complete len:312 (+),score=6.73 GHVU01104780.1:32-967(+)